MDTLSHRVTVACDQQAAFDLFTTGMGTWWDPRFTPDPATFTDIELHPGVGGAIVLRHGELRHQAGEVVVWEPPRRYALRSWLTTGEAHATHVEVRFEADDGVCTVHVEHTGWDATTDAARDGEDDWPIILGWFAQAAARLA